MSKGIAPFFGNSNAENEKFCQLLNEVGKALTRDFSARDGVFSGETPEKLKKILSEMTLLPNEGIGSLKTLSMVEEKILPHLVNPASQNYMAHLHCASLTDGVIAELLLSVYNQSMDSWDQAPMATELEMLVLKEFCKIIGYPETADGVFTSGGSQSNLMGVIIARENHCNNKMNHDIRKKGLPTNFAKFRIYTSEVAHFSIEKSAQMLGLGFQAVRSVPVDAQKKMSMTALRKMILEDIAEGNIPFAISATAGTTDFGSIDPLLEIRKICDEFNMFMHTDAAYGGGLLVSDKYKNRVKGIELSDSITVDFHKMYFLPVSCSLFMLKDPSLFEMLEIHADYLNREEDEEEGYTHLVGRSLATTRRFDALKVFMSFNSLGKKNLSALIEQTVVNASEVYSYLLTDKRFETVCEPEISSVVFRYVSNVSEEKNEYININVRKSLLHDSAIILGQTKVNGKTHLKMTLLNPAITFDSVKEILMKICDLAVTFG